MKRAARAGNYRSCAGIIVLSALLQFFFLAQPHLPLPKRAQWKPGAVGKVLVRSSWQKRRWMARELLGVEWGWSSTTILSPSPLSTAPSPDSSQRQPLLLAASSTGGSPPASSPSAFMFHRTPRNTDSSNNSYKEHSLNSNIGILSEN